MGDRPDPPLPGARPLPSIKMTVYRVGSDTPFARPLIRAAEAGKQVACVIGPEGALRRCTGISLRASSRHTSDGKSRPRTALGDPGCLVTGRAAGVGDGRQRPLRATAAAGRRRRDSTCRHASRLDGPHATSRGPKRLRVTSVADAEILAWKASTGRWPGGASVVLRGALRLSRNDVHRASSHRYAVRAGVEPAPATKRLPSHPPVAPPATFSAWAT